MSNKKQAEQALRKKAEEISRTTAKELPTNLGEMSTEEVRLLLHELQVHQIELEMQNTELRRTQEELDAERRRYFDLYDIAPVGYCTVSEEGLLLEANLAAINLLGVTRNTLPGQRMSRFILEEDQNGYYLFRRNLFASGQPQSCELRMVKKDKTIFSAHLAAVLAGGVSSAPVCRIVLSDISERKEAEEELKKIKWMLTSKQPLSASVPPGKDIEDQGYGDLTALNRGGLISRSIDKEILRDISTEYLNLLETSSAIYEKNGDYAYGIFCSGWCRLMDGASRKLCHTEDNEFALASGKWLCHESCWTNCSQRAIESRSPVDIECSGGIHLYAVPIFSAGEVIGAINFGYGDPPKDTAKLRSLAEAYAVDPKKLALEADAYASRPTYIVELAKQRLLSSARLVGIMVERKQAEEALREQSDFSESLIETAQVIILVLDTQGRIVRFNHYMEQLVGYDLDEVKGMDWFETFLTPEIDPTIKPLFQKTVADIHTSGNVNPIVAKDGRLILVEWYNKILKDKEGRTVGVLAIGQDITERTQAEAALKESQKRFHQIFLDHNAIMLLVNPETGVIQEANPAAANFYGHSTEQLRRMTIEDINTLSAEEVARHRSQAIAGAGNYFIFPHRLADGQIRTVEVYSSPIAFNSETLLFSIIHDISERKQAELEVQKLNVELEQRIADRTEDLRNSQLALLNVVDDLNLHAKNLDVAYKKLEAANKELEAFSYTVSHDLRAPLRHIGGFVELLKEKLPSSTDEETGHFLKVIADSAVQMSRLVDDLLSFSRMGRDEISMARVNLDQLVAAAIHTLQPAVQGRDISWKVSTLPEVVGDGAMLRLVMVNLIANAVKFTAKKSHAVIEIGCDRSKEDEYIFFVRDNGAGFDMKYADKLFALFQRLHRAEDFEGTGAGLAIVQRIIQRHGGRTWAEGAVGSGSVFSFSLPRA